MLFLALAFAAGVAHATDVRTTLNEAQILTVVHQLNQGQIDEAKVVLSKSTSEPVKAFAQHALDENTALQTAADALAKLLDRKSTSSDTDDKLAADQKLRVAQLKKLVGADLDRQYVANVVDEHTSNLDLIDYTLAPQTQNTKVKSALDNTRASAQSSLDQAKALQPKP